MNSKECLENLTYCVNGMESKEKYYKIIKQDLDKLDKLEKDIKEYRKAIKSWNVNAGNLLKEIIKLKKFIEILKEAVDEIDFITCDEEDCYGEVGLYQKINESISIPLKTKEEYILVKEVLEND